MGSTGSSSYLTLSPSLALILLVNFLKASDDLLASKLWMKEESTHKANSETIKNFIV